MKAMWTAFVAIIAIAFGASYALQEIGFTSEQRTSSSAVRLGADVQ